MFLLTNKVEGRSGGPHSILKFMLARVRVGQVFRGNLVDGARL
jgi:hypothetical protein